MSIIEYIEAVREQGKWDYKRLGSQYENFGNYNFAVTGTARGFSPGALRRGAGLIQMISNTSKPDYGNFLGSAPHGDDPKDQGWIGTGIFDYNTGVYGSNSNRCEGGTEGNAP